MKTFSDLSIHPRIKHALQKASFDDEAEILKLSSAEIQKKLNISEQDAVSLCREVAQKIYPLPIKLSSGLKLLNQSISYLTTADSGIDNILGGGILPSILTEVVGESASGKTQLCLQLCLTVQFPLSSGGLDGSAIYLHSEGKFPVDRLQQLIKSFQRRYPNHLDDPNSKIHIVNIADAETQYHVIKYHLPVYIKQKNARLVIIDSIAALYRGEQFDYNDKSRTTQKKELCEIGIILNELSSTYKCAIVCTNQVSDTFNHESTSSLIDKDTVLGKWRDLKLKQDDFVIMFSKSLEKTPALGLVWSNSINMRIRFARSPRLDDVPSRRLFCIEFAPHLENSGCEIYIDINGVHSGGNNVNNNRLQNSNETTTIQDTA